MVGMGTGTKVGAFEILGTGDVCCAWYSSVCVEAEPHFYTRMEVVRCMNSVQSFVRCTRRTWWVLSRRNRLRSGRDHARRRLC
jgi:hypothetical protein